MVLAGGAGITADRMAGVDPLSWTLHIALVLRVLIWPDLVKYGTKDSRDRTNEDE